jgi:hypothetical protein
VIIFPTLHLFSLLARSHWIELGLASIHRPQLSLDIDFKSPPVYLVQRFNHAIEVIKSHPSGDYLILTDSLSSIESMKSCKIMTKIHPVVNVIKDALWNLQGQGASYCVRSMWIPSHCNWKLTGNEEADRLAREGSESLHYARAKPIVSDFYPKFKKIMMEKWQQMWENYVMGRYAFSIYPHVDLGLVDLNSTKH